MSRSKQCISPPDFPASPRSELDPEVSVFRHVALLQVPEPWRPALLHAGIAIFDWSLEVFGIAHEEPDSEAITARRLEAIAADLGVSGRQLRALGLESESSVMTRVEQKLCAKAAKLSAEALDLAARLRKAARR